MTDANVAGFEPLYDAAEHDGRRIPGDIGGPQQLVAYGGIRGEVLDPGTGRGHSIHFAAQGYSTTGVDDSPSAIEQAKRNAERSGVIGPLLDDHRVHLPVWSVVAARLA